MNIYTRVETKKKKVLCIIMAHAVSTFCGASNCKRLPYLQPADTIMHPAII